MGRTLMYTAITVLAVLALSATFVLEHGGESVAAVPQVSVLDLAIGSSRFDGKAVATVGELSFSEEHDRYQLVGEESFAVIIREYTGGASLDSLAGLQVRVRGLFGIDAEFGVYIDASYVGPVAN